MAEEISCVQKIWGCKIGLVSGMELPSGADEPMRNAVRQAFKELTGKEPDFIFSGWGEELTDVEQEVLDHQGTICGRED